MSAPFIYVGTYRIKPDKQEAFEQMCSYIAGFVEANEPRVIAFNFYLDAEGTEASCVQVHPDAESMVLHMELLREHIAAAGGGESPIDVVTSNQIYGTPSDRVLEMINEFDIGVPLIVKPHPVSGFTRPDAERVAVQ